MSIDGNSTLEQEANRWALQSHRDALRAELLMLDQEILSFDVRKELTSARRDQLRAQQKQVRARRSYLENEADRLRLVDAKQVSTETEIAQRETADAHPLIKSLVKEDLALGDQILRVTQQLSEIDEQQARLESDTLRLEEDFRSARQQLEAAGLNRILGRMVARAACTLTRLGKLRRAARIREDKIAELTLSQIRHRDELRRLGEVDNYLDDLLGQLPTDPPAGLRDELRTRVEYRRDLLRRTLSLEEDYRHALTELDLTGDRYMDTVQRYGDFLAERLLWVPSVAPITQQSFANLPAAIYWLISPLNWLGVLDVLRFEATRSPLLWLGLLAVLLLLWRGSAIRRGVRDSAEHLRRISTDRFSYTLKALGLTVLAASTWPLLLMVLGFQLANSLESDEFARAVGAGMIAVGPALYYLRSFRLLCMPGGVADRHFRWSSDVLMLLRRTFAWAASLLLPIGFVTATIYHNANPDFSGTLDRMSLVAFNLGLAVFTAWLMHPRTGAVKHLLENNPQGWANRLRGLWFSVLIAVPLALALLALAGYLYTSGILVESLLSELWLVLGLLVAHQLIVRWLIVARRSLALQATLERRAQREAQRAAESQSGQDEEYKSDEIPALAAAEPEIDSHPLTRKQAPAEYHHRHRLRGRALADLVGRAAGVEPVRSSHALVLPGHCRWHRAAGSRHIGRPRADFGNHCHCAGRRQEPAGAAGDPAAQAYLFHSRQPLYHDHIDRLCHHRHRHHLCLQYPRVELGRSAMADCGAQRWYRLRPAGNRGKFHQWPDYSIRASGAGR